MELLEMQSRVCDQITLLCIVFLYLYLVWLLIVQQMPGCTRVDCDLTHLISQETVIFQTPVL